MLPNTDAALQLAIMYMWITEGTYDKEYVEDPHGRLRQDQGLRARRRGRRTQDPAVGLAQVRRAYLDHQGPRARLGQEDGHHRPLLRAAAWPVARTRHEPARLEVVLLGMQGLGKPGVHQSQIAYLGMPRNILGAGRQYMDMFNNLATSPVGDRLLKPHRGTPQAWGKQLIPKTLIEEAIRSPPVDFWGTGGHEEPTVRPVQEVHLSHREGEGRHRVPHDVDRHALPGHLLGLRRRHHGRRAGTRRSSASWRSTPGWRTTCLSADIILPTNTTFEVNDIMLNLRDGDSFQTVVLMRKAIEPVGESRSDYEAVCAVAEKLGMLDEVTDGFSEAELIKGVFDGMRLRQDRELGGVPGEGLLGGAVRDRLAEAHGRLVRLLQGPGEEPHPHAHRQAGVLVGEPGRMPSPTTRSARPSRSGSRRASPTTSASRARGPGPIRCWSCPTTAGGECTPSATTSPGPRKRSPARSGAGTATGTSRAGCIPAMRRSGASRTATS